MNVTNTRGEHFQLSVTEEAKMHSTSGGDETNKMKTLKSVQTIKSGGEMVPTQ